jgi:hypothetical protein
MFPFGELTGQAQKLFLRIEAVGYRFVDRQHPKFDDLVTVRPRRFAARL